jgi:hypothetical protein
VLSSVATVSPLRVKTQWPPVGVLVMAMSWDVPCVMVPQPARQMDAPASMAAI